MEQKENRSAEAVIACAEWIKEHAGELTDFCDFLCEMIISIEFLPDELPTVTVRKKHVQKEAALILNRKS